MSRVKGKGEAWLTLHAALVETLATGKEQFNSHGPEGCHIQRWGKRVHIEDQGLHRDPRVLALEHQPDTTWTMPDIKGGHLEA